MAGETLETFQELQALLLGGDELVIAHVRWLATRAAERWFRATHGWDCACPFCDDMVHVVDRSARSLVGTVDHARRGRLYLEVRDGTTSDEIEDLEIALADAICQDLGPVSAWTKYVATLDEKLSRAKGETRRKTGDVVWSATLGCFDENRRSAIADVARIALRPRGGEVH